ncbi:MAG TPA: ABC transporter permease subunit [Anaerolineales bacterium]|nr:ABC transporter permease subunit [Anaerolineales bacterium]
MTSLPDPSLRRPRRISLAWVGLLPFFLFALAFLFAPSSSLLFGSFLDSEGALTFKNILGLSQPSIRNAYWLSIRISAVTAVVGGLFGFLLAYAVTLGRLPRWVRTSLITFSGVASNFAGVPLAFAFIAVLGRTGVITQFLEDAIGLEIYDHGFNLYSFAGLSLTYLYFQFPLMVLIMAPALDGLKREWREASENLGATSQQYWRYIALPILLPSILGTMILLFGNAFGAYATAFALTGGSLNLVTIQIGAQMRGDVLHNPGLGYALAFGMVIVMAISIGLYTWLQRLSERWLR